MKTGAELIADERKRQIEEEGFSLEHDAQYTNYELVNAAMCYLLTESNRVYDRMRLISCMSEYKDKDVNDITIPPSLWPWDKEWWKPSPDNRIRELAIVGALAAAEIDRLQNLQNN